MLSLTYKMVYVGLKKIVKKIVHVDWVGDKVDKEGEIVVIFWWRRLAAVRWRMMAVVVVE